MVNIKLIYGKIIKEGSIGIEISDLDMAPGFTTTTLGWARVSADVLSLY